MDLVDTHAHLDDEAFAADLPAVMERAAAAGVTTVVAIGTDAGSSHRVIALAEQHPQVNACVGIHPHEAGTAPPEAVRDLTAWTDHPRVVAVGETGLDYYRDFAPRSAQVGLFRAHLALAREVGLPVVIHCRDAYPDVLAILEEFADVTCIFHAFSPSPPPHPSRRQRNEPARVRLVAERLANVRDISLEVVAAATTVNARRVFRLERVEARA